MEELDGYYDDDGTKVDPNLIPKPSLCILCKKDDDPDEEIICNLTRLDQRDEEQFICYELERKS